MAYNGVDSREVDYDGLSLTAEQQLEQAKHRGGIPFILTLQNDKQDLLEFKKLAQASKDTKPGSPTKENPPPLVVGGANKAGKDAAPKSPTRKNSQGGR